MLQANPQLTPNQAKAILQYTAQVYPNFDPLTEGAGFLNAKGAVELARYLASPAATPYPDDSTWGKRIIWGNRLLSGGRLRTDGNAWPVDVMWGSGFKGRTFGIACSNADCTSTGGPWRADRAWHNVVWGLLCAGVDCGSQWSVEAVSAAGIGETVVWGTTDGGETVVWGTDAGETVVWGTDGGETVVWGTGGVGETVVWGTACTDPSCTPVIWSRP
jgi:hypothetical protein